MRATLILLAAAGLVLAPSAALSETRAPVPGPNNPNEQTNVVCSDDAALHSPGSSADAPGRAFNQDGQIGTFYASEQDQQSKTVASVSRYDGGCTHTQSGG